MVQPPVIAGLGAGVTTESILTARRSDAPKCRPMSV